jgi:anti-sigma B factor antagonist
MNEKDGVQIKTEFLDKEGQIMLLKLSGFIDQSNSNLLEKTVLNGLESGCYKLIFDFGNLTYMSSAGWGVLVGEIKRFRQYGGDIKLVNLNSDLYEVYQMLEFYHIIDEYPSIEDALDSFTIDQDFNLLVNPPDEKQIQQNTNKNNKEEFVDENNLDSSSNNEHTTKEKSNNSGIIEKEIEIEFGDNSEKDIENYSTNNISNSNKGYVAFKPLSFERQVDVKILPLAEKVRRIVSQFPQLGPFKIKKILQHPDFGNVKVGYFKLKSLLKDLDLDTKEKRFRFYRST